MIVDAFEYTMKDGRTAVIRSPRDEDIPSTLDYLYESACETEFLLRYPEECGKYTPEGEKAFFERANTASNQAMLVCIVDEKVVGTCQITWPTGLKTRHRANVAIALLRDYWGQGLGTRLFQELIRIAEQNEDLLQLELEFIEGNARARALYEKMGFRIVGIRPRAIRLKDGRLLNEYIMIRDIER